MRYIYPPHPRPKAKLTRLALPGIDVRTWVAQLKFNGVHVVIWTDGNQCEIRDRRNTPLTTYKLTKEMERLILGLYSGKELVLAGELLHTKAKKNGQQVVTNTIVLFDVLYEGMYLGSQRTIQKNVVERLEDLNRICKYPREDEPGERGKIISTDGESQLWMADTFFDDFLYRFDSFFDYDQNGQDRYPEIEGLMLKMKTGKLGIGLQQYDVNWIVRCRKAKPKMYSI